MNTYIDLCVLQDQLTTYDPCMYQVCVYMNTYIDLCVLRDQLTTYDPCMK